MIENPNEDDSESYHTPLAGNSKLSASLRAGTYDTNAEILRTCSLPELNSLVSDSDNDKNPWENAKERSPVNSTDNSNQGESPSHKEIKDEGAADEAEFSAEEEEEDEKDEVWSSSEDEDLQRLVETLQSFVEESSE